MLILGRVDVFAEFVRGFPELGFVGFFGRGFRFLGHKILQ